jgi:CHAD domain-containing protein
MLQGVSEGDVDAVHRMRVATRRLRELLPVLPGAGEDASKLRRRLKAVTRQLGPLRELDVSAALVDELRGSACYDPRAIDALASSLERDRARARRSVTGKRATLERARLGRRLRKVAEELERDASSASAVKHLGWAVHARVVARAGPLERAIVTAGAVYLPERLHGVRIALKKLRYALELFVELGGAPESDLRLLKEKQDVLGRMHDLQMLTARARRLEAAPDESGASVAALSTLVDALEDECRRLHARYLSERGALEALAMRLAGRARVAGARPARAGRRAIG